MPTKTYHKLVRDRIPEIIEADGKTCVCETLSDEDYIALLRNWRNIRRANLWKNSPTFWRSCRRS